jgi:[acyl-carrier-protein] S-malonyltransferase
MRPAAERLRERIQSLQVRVPSIAFLNDVDAASEREPDRIRDAMSRQLYNPVRWVEILKAMGALGATQVAECGPGGVLTGVNRRANPDLKAIPFKDAQSLTDLIQAAKN